MNKFFGFGLRRSKNNKCLDLYFPVIEANERVYVFLKKFFSLANVDFKILSVAKLVELLSRLNFKAKSTIEKFLSLKSTNNYAQCDFIIFIFNKSEDCSIKSTEEAYFKLQMLSKRIVTPHNLNLEGLFSKLINVAWSNYGPLLPEDVEEMRIAKFFTDRPLQISHIDKFPYLLNYEIPSQVRVADARRVRLGAYLGEGTTIMPAGYVNFNAGTLKNAMVEGRISAGVLVGENSDIGGGGSIMGTLSGGNDIIISIGKNCLLGANAGTGISLGNGCTIAAGLYVYAGMKISLYGSKGQAINLLGENVREGENIVKAKELSGRANLLFLQDSQSGKVIVRPNLKQIELNEELHNN